MTLRQFVREVKANENLILPNSWRVLSSINDLTANQRRILFANVNCPFHSFEFLAALENSGSIGQGTGWIPEYLLCEDSDDKYGLLIGYQKTDSYGEYVFDWAWADAFHRNGIHYYPKYTIGIPFSPVPCRKLVGNLTLSMNEALSIAFQYAESNQYSGVHLLFAEKEINDAKNFITRKGHQFHWFNNRNIAKLDAIDECLLQNESNQFKSFTDFLSILTARKRKMILKERSKVKSHFSFSWKSGEQITNDELNAFYLSYQSTYIKRGRSGYLSLAFFQEIFKSLATKVRLLLCFKEDEIVATALYFVDEDTLYGRYWGALAEFDYLHFEACYYQGIEYCIKHKIKRFNPGTQGEHKIARGFKPVETTSLHSIFLQPFHDAIERFCNEESVHNEAYISACSERLPYKLDL